MKSALKKLFGIFAMYLITMLSFGLLSSYAVNLSTISLSKTNIREFIIIMILFPLIVLSLYHIAKRFSNLLIPVQKDEYDDEGELLVPEFNMQVFKKKLLCFGVVLLTSAVAFAIEMYVLSIISGAEMGIKTLGIMTIMASVCTTLFSSLIYKMVIKPISVSECGKKGITVYCIIIALLTVAFMLYVPQTITRMETYSSYWDGGHGTPYVFEYEIDDTCKMKIDNKNGLSSDGYVRVLDQFSKEELRNFADSGWVIVIDSDYLAEHSWQESGKKYIPEEQYRSLRDDSHKKIYVANSYAMQQELVKFFE